MELGSAAAAMERPWGRTLLRRGFALSFPFLAGHHGDRGGPAGAGTRIAQHSTAPKETGMKVE